jgi:flagellar hook-associated protein 2
VGKIISTEPLLMEKIMVASAGSGSISFDGLSSGLNTNEIVESMVEASKSSMRQLEKREEVLSAHKSAYEDVSHLVQELEKQVSSLGTASSFVTRTAKSSNEEILRASAGVGAINGVYQIEVKSLASGQRSFSAPQPSATEPTDLKEGTIAWSVGEDQYQVDISAGATLQDVVNAINGTGGGIQATLLFDGDVHRLQLTGVQVGVKKRIIFAQDDTGLALADPKNIVHQARDAELVLDGITTIHRPDNVINDVLAGMSFVLEDEGPPVRVRVTENTGAMSDQIKEFVKAYNEVITAVGKYTRYEGKHDPKKLAGDSTLANLTQSLQQSITRPVSGSRGPISAITHLGITTNREGKLDVDDAKLNYAVVNQTTYVTKLFGRDIARKTPGISARLHDVTAKFASTGSGQLSAKTKSIDTQKEGMVRRRAQMQVHADKYEETLRKQFTDLEKNMSKLKSQNGFLQGQANNGGNKN